jgi:hypothetical protein
MGHVLSEITGGRKDKTRSHVPIGEGGESWAEGESVEVSMKFKVQMKDPDTLCDAIRDAVKAQIQEIGITDSDEIEALSEKRAEKIDAICSEWFEYGEYLTVEIDTEAKTATVCKARE